MNDQDTMKRTALHIASEVGHASIVIALLANTAHYDALDCEGPRHIFKFIIIHNAFIITVEI